MLTLSLCKCRRIWTQAERQVKQAMVREEMARVEALKAACSTTQYLTIQAFAVQAYRCLFNPQALAG